MKTLLIASLLTIGMASAQAQGTSAAPGSLPASAMPETSVRDMIQSPIQLRHNGFPVKDSPFSDPTLANDPSPNHERAPNTAAQQD